MSYFLITLVIAVFLALLFLNIYFRIKVLKHYKYLVQNKVEFEAKHILNKKKMEAEVLPLYPKHAHEINSFAANIRNSVFLASMLIILITIAGLILKNS